MADVVWRTTVVGTLDDARRRYADAHSWADTVRAASRGRSVRRIGGTSLYGATDDLRDVPLTVCWCGRTFVKVPWDMIRHNLTYACNARDCEPLGREARQAQALGLPIPEGPSITADSGTDKLRP